MNPNSNIGPNTTDTVVKIIIALVLLLIIIGVLVYVGWTNTINNVTNNEVISTPIPPVTAPTTSGAAFVEAVSQKAVPTNTINISNCTPEPPVAEFTNKASIKFVNDDAVIHSVSFSPAQTYFIPSKTSITKVFDFWKLPGVREYSCDSKAKAGMVVITVSQSAKTK
ncbi:MAG: hypothetical protein NT077_01715 [Candidatus Taylorbacteria bacterium]|nr:hypothetical protein [Candidatus Taylorbacteria bacterium]